MKKDVKVKKATSITVRLFRGITITIISIVGFICAVIGVQLYKKNIIQFDEFTAQQFFNIEKSVSLFIQNGKSVTFQKVLLQKMNLQVFLRHSK